MISFKNIKLESEQKPKYFDEIKDLGNCGNKTKLLRIINAIEVARQNNAYIIIRLDPLVYGKNLKKIDPTELISVSYSDTDIIINGITMPWWDIDKVYVSF